VTLSDPLSAAATRFGPALDRELREAVPDESRGAIYRLVRYHLGWATQNGVVARAEPGKRLRPYLLLLACESAGGRADGGLPAAAAVELLHNFSLIHDDIQDRSPQRRHRATVWSIWGEAQAINAGDVLHAIASRSFLRCAERGVSLGATHRALALFHESCYRLVEGQYLDLTFESRVDVSPAEYLAMVDGKTGALIAACVEIGAVLAGRDGAAWRAVGRAFGRAFQIVDDVLGVWGDPAVLGKSVDDDIRSAKKSLPVLLARESLSATDRTCLDTLYGADRRSDDDVETIRRMLDQSGARERALDHARAAAMEGEAALAVIQERGAAVAPLTSLLRVLVERHR